MRVLYATGEESVGQAAGNARRVGAAKPKVWIVAETRLEVILEHIADTHAQVVVIDSIQTARSAELAGAPGAPSQVAGCTLRLASYAKEHGISLIIIGHVTKDDGLAGPRTLEHLVDVVLTLEGEPSSASRVLRVGKNRFGPSNVVGQFMMTETGLAAIAEDPFEVGERKHEPDGSGER